MTNCTKIVPILVLLVAGWFGSAGAYEIPSRKIELKPYLNVLFPRDLLRSESGLRVVKDETGIGFGVKIRTQWLGPFGLAVDASITDTEVENERLGATVIFTAGPFYSLNRSFGNVVVEPSFGVLSAGDCTTTIFVSGLEYNRAVSERVLISMGLNWLIANDWFYNYDVEETYGSVSLSLGAGFIF